jgi:hypothetical protein
VRAPKADDEPAGVVCASAVWAAVTSEAGTWSTDRMPLATAIRDVERTSLPIWVRLLPWPPGSQRVVYEARELVGH